MSTSPSPGSEDDGSLSARERRILAGIEDDLAAGDPRLAVEMSSHGRRSTARWWPLSATSTGLLIVAVPVLVVVGALLPTSWLAVLAIVTTLVVPLLLLAAIEKVGSN
jgi:Protein of unknown function (DUF3040)